MAVSYLSKPYEVNPYVLPVDLNLLARVNQYKQTQFYANADKIGTMIGNLKNTDILNKAQADKLLAQYTNLNNQLNQAGAIDYSDKNLTNQIESYGSEIYNDEDIRRGISSTKRVRQFQANVEKMQTDPKLSKYYNVSNITRIMQQQINPYVNGDITAGYSGPTAPRPYEGNPFEKILKNMKNLPPDIIVKPGPSGVPSLYSITTKEELSATDIDAVFDGLIDANTKAQLMDDAWYNFDYATGGKFDKKMGQDLYNNEMLNNARSFENSLNANIIRLKTETDPDKRKELEKNNIQLQNEIDIAKQRIEKGSNEFGTMYDANPDQAKYSLYVGKLRNSIIKAAGFSKEKIDYKTNQEWLFNRKMELAAFEKGYVLNSDGKTYSQLPWSAAAIAAAGGTKTKGNGAGLNGEELVTNVNFLAGSTRTTKETEALKIDERVVRSQINNYRMANNDLANKFLMNFSQTNGMDQALGYKQNVNTTVGGVAQTKSSDFIANLAGADGLLDKADIDEIIRQANDASDNIVGNVNYQGKKFGVTHDQLKVLNDLQTAWSAVAKGEIDKLPESFNGMRQEFIEFNKQYERNQLNVDNREKYINNVYNSAFAELKSTPEEQALYREYMAGGQSERDRIANQFFAEGGRNDITGKFYKTDTDANRDTPNIVPTALGKKLEKFVKGVDANMKKAFEVAGQTYNYYETILNLTDPDNKAKVTNLVTTLAQSGQGNITPRSIRRTDDGKKWKILYTYGTNDAFKGDVDIDNATAVDLGVPMLKYPELQESFRYGDTETKQLNTYIKVVPKVPSGQTPVEIIQPVAYKIFKKAEGNYLPVIIYKGKNYEIKSKQKLTNTDLAYDLLETVTNVKYESLDQLLQGIEKYNNQF
jgi:hypothetical protein